MFFFVLTLFTLAAFASAFGLWLLFWSFAMSTNEQAQIELLGQTNTTEN